MGLRLLQFLQLLVARGLQYQNTSPSVRQLVHDNIPPPTSTHTYTHTYTAWFGFCLRFALVVLVLTVVVYFATATTDRTTSYFFIVSPCILIH